MFRRLFTYLIGIYFLAGCLIFPLGDFSLITELPNMYRSYQKIADVNERGIDDFIGDYLLGGRDLFGHNKNDASDKSTPVKFQRTAAVSFVIKVDFQVVPKVLPRSITRQYAVELPVATSEFHPEFFRPPSGTIN